MISPHSNSVLQLRTTMKLFVDQLTNSDFCFLHPSRGLLGETWLSHITLDGELDEQGMVLDFGIVKKIVRNWLDDVIDHRLLVPSKYKNLLFSANANQLELTWTCTNGDTIIHRSPQEAVTFIDCAEITPDSVATWSEKQLRALLPESVKEIHVAFTTENIDGAFYHYGHGLKKHDGKCQRIAHGHRSKIEIYRNGKRDNALEEHWCKKFQDIYIGTKEDLIETTATNLQFYYQSKEGDFSLSLPINHCYLIDTDSTVENIALHISNEIERENPNQPIAVKAYEGLAKGAWVTNDETLT